MKDCTNCAYAQWKRTAAGRLHPSGDGICRYEYKVPPLPACMYWLGYKTPSGGYISRGKELKEHCPYFTWSQK